MKKIEWILRIHTVSEANLIEHWSKKHKRHKKQKQAISMAFILYKPAVKLPCIIKLSRLSPRLLDSDNLQFSFKWIRDEIANQLIPGLKAGRADDDPNLTWQYDQEKSKEKAIKVEFSY